MSQTIKRKATGARKTAAAQNTAQKVRKAKARTGSTLDSVMAWVPLTEEQLHRVFLATILGGALALAWGVAAYAGLPALATEKIAGIAESTGFEVRRVRVEGLRGQRQQQIYDRAFAESSRAMPLVDLDALRGELMQLPWVEDARVSRQLPDTLVVDVVERKPHAVLRKGGQLVLIDPTGHEIEAVSPTRARGKLIVEGDGAGQQVLALAALLDAAPALKPQVRGAEWVGNRRWNLTFRTGQVLALPEGGDKAANALMAFARLDGTNRLLGGRVAAFDMRAADRIYFRVPGRAEDAAKAAVTSALALAAPAAKPSAASGTASSAAASSPASTAKEER